MADDLYATFTKKTCPIDPMRRTTCQKCGNPTHANSDENAGRMAWCDTCRWLLRDPDTGHRYSNVRPPETVLRRIGLFVTFDERQLLERIPNDSQVELWPELRIEQPLEAPPRTLEELFGRRA
jgi:hypothetical protein